VCVADFDGDNAVLLFNPADSRVTIQVQRTNNVQMISILSVRYTVLYLFTENFNLDDTVHCAVYILW
jgi:hypothetical protein